MYIIFYYNNSKEKNILYNLIYTFIENILQSIYFVKYNIFHRAYRRDNPRQCRCCFQRGVEALVPFRFHDGMGFTLENNNNI